MRSLKDIQGVIFETDLMGRLERSWKGLVSKFLPFSMMAVTLLIFNHFLTFIEKRQGPVLADPLLSGFNAIDLSWPIFILIYLQIALFLFAQRKNTSLLQKTFLAYTWLTLFRMLFIYFVPLDPPAGIILLRDPIVEIFGGTRILTRDLFFSGHVSLMFLLCLTTGEIKMRRFFYTLTFLVAAFLLAQKVHYTIDVVAAPFFSYVALRLAHRLSKSSEIDG